MKIDPRSDRIALHYTGNDAGEPAISGVPARDLTENDVARLVYIEHGDLSGAAHSAAIDKLADTLTDGPYRRTPEPPKAKGKSKRLNVSVEPTVTTEVATPPPTEPSVDSTEGEV